MPEVFHIDQDYPQKSMQEIQSFAIQKLIPPEFRARFNGSAPRYISALFKHKCAEARVYETLEVDLGVLKSIVDMGLKQALREEHPNEYLDEVSAKLRSETTKLKVYANTRKLRAAARIQVKT
jgi:hypothetical protein